MGLTIHYELEFVGNEAQVKDKLLKVRDKAKELGFAKVGELKKLDNGYVINLCAGDGCDPTNISLITADGVYWVGDDFTKTQYAKDFLRCHLLVIAILDYIKELGFLKEVYDEGGYWESRSIERLAKNINANTTAIISLLNEFQSAGLKVISPIENVKILW